MNDPRIFFVNRVYIGMYESHTRGVEEAPFEEDKAKVAPTLILYTPNHKSNPMKTPR